MQSIASNTSRAVAPRRNRRRMSRKDTVNRVYSAVHNMEADSKGYMTMRDVAHELDMRPSTYVMNMLKELWVSNEINMATKANSRGIIVYCWYPSKPYQMELI